MIIIMIILFLLFAANLVAVFRLKFLKSIAKIVLSVIIILNFAEGLMRLSSQSSFTIIQHLGLKREIFFLRSQ